MVTLLVELTRQDRDGNTTVMVAGMIIAALVPTLASIATFITARASKQEVAKVHQAVNSERTASLQKIEDLRNEILVLSKQNSSMQTRESTGESLEKAVEKVGEKVVGQVDKAVDKVVDKVTETLARA